MKTIGWQVLVLGWLTAGCALAQEGDGPLMVPDSASGQQSARVMAVPYTPRNVWRADREASTARLFVGREASPFLFNAAVAGASGNVAFDPHRPGEGAVAVTIYPAGEGRAPVNAEGRLANGRYPNSADYAEMTFRSTHGQLRSDGQWEATGELTLTRIERPATTDPNEAYAGPLYGSPQVSTWTRQATFVFSSQPQMSNQAARVVRVAHIQGAAFPELMPAVLHAEWPQVVERESCENNATTGEDYAGPVCAGQVVSAIPLLAPATMTSEDFHGTQPHVPAGDQVTLRVELIAGNDAGGPRNPSSR